MRLYRPDSPWILEGTTDEIVEILEALDQLAPLIDAGEFEDLKRAKAGVRSH